MISDEICAEFYELVQRAKESLLVIFLVASIGATLGSIYWFKFPKTYQVDTVFFSTIPGVDVSQIKDNIHFLLEKHYAENIEIKKEMSWGEEAVFVQIKNRAPTLSFQSSTSIKAEELARTINQHIIGELTAISLQQALLKKETRDLGTLDTEMLKIVDISKPAEPVGPNFPVVLFLSVSGALFFFGVFSAMKKAYLRGKKLQEGETQKFN